MDLSVELLQRYDRPGPRYTSYPTAVDFLDDFEPADAEAAYARAANEQGPISLYVHVPFCEARCYYCACNVIVSPRHGPEERYLELLMREIDLVADRLGNRREVAQLHWGGGTPTFLAPVQMRTLVDHIRSRFTLLPGAEVAVEVDPRVTTDVHLDELLALGFNRFSLGVQDIDERVQKVIGRIQPFAMTKHIVDRIRAAGTFSINFDLVYGLPAQTAETWSSTLDKVLELRPDRLAIYSFAWLPDRYKHQQKIDASLLPEPNEKLALLVEARRRLLDAGYVDIGLDHFALETDELSVAQKSKKLHRNFMGYTTLKADDMVGFGVSSIGCVAGTWIQNVKKLSDYAAAIDAGELPVERGIRMSDDDLIRAEVIRELMCNFVVDTDAIEKKYGITWDVAFAVENDGLRALEAEGLVRRVGSRIEVIDLGRLFVRVVAMLFDRYRRNGGRGRFSRTV